SSTAWAAVPWVVAANGSGSCSPTSLPKANLAAQPFDSVLAVDGDSAARRTTARSSATRFRPSQVSVEATLPPFLVLVFWTAGHGRALAGRGRAAPRGCQSSSP